MENDNTQSKHEIVFSEEIGSVILGILKSFSLREEPDKIFEKLIEHKPLNGEFVRLCVEDVAIGKTRKEDLPRLFQKHFNITAETSEKLTNEIKNKVLSMAEKVNMGAETTPLMQPPKKIHPAQNSTTRGAEENEKVLKQSRESARNNMIERKEFPKSNSDSDRYREPIS